jgi:hypothetical protein
MGSPVGRTQNTNKHFHYRLQALKGCGLLYETECSGVMGLSETKPIVDDGEFVPSQKQNIIHACSAWRLGWVDVGRVWGHQNDAAFIRANGGKALRRKGIGSHYGKTAGHALSWMDRDPSC